jgi:hydroxymethylglutaryl-CoA synthase
VGLFSYGSGAVSEFFSMTVMDGYKHHLSIKENQALLSERSQLTMEAYEDMFNEKLPVDGGTYTFSDSTPFAINKISGDIRYYNK